MSEVATPATKPRPSAAGAFWRPETGIFLALWLFFMVVGQDKLFHDPGTFWHTIVGRRMLDSGQLIYTDPFTFTWQGKHWIGHQWLGECLMGLIDRIDGLDSLLLAAATILAALYAWVAQRFMRAGLHWSLASVLVMLVVAASSSHFHIRPHLATIVFLGVTMGYLVDWEAGRIGWRRLWWLVPVYLVWTSIHGGTLGGLLTMGLALAGWTVYRLLGQETPIKDVRRFVGFTAVLAACTLTILINPYGLWLPRTWLGIMESATLTRIIIEHRPLSLEETDGWLVVLLAGVYLAALLSTWPRWPRVCWLLPLVWLYFACSRVRHGPLFAITAGLALADMLPFTRFASWATRGGSDLFRPPLEEKDSIERSRWKPAVVPVLLVATALVLQAAHVEVPVVGHHWARPDLSRWPIELLPALRDVERDKQKDYPDGIPIFNEYSYGGFLIYYTPGYRVFVDDRCELYREPGERYPDQWLDEFVQASSPGMAPTDRAAAIHEWEDRYGHFPYALVQTAGGFDNYFRNSPDWIVIKRTPTATFYQRKT
jgi:hypothetical protein